MIEVRDEELQPLSHFPLRWRWMDPKYHQLPAEPLANIKPLSPPKAKAVWAVFRPFAYDDSLAPDLFKPIVQFNARSRSPDDLRAWLGGFDIDRQSPVIVSWRPDLAVSVPFGVFCDYCDDFCYPSSDNVIVCPYTEEWAIFYHHEEVWFFGRRRALPRPD
jgi:hypothetical protein